MEICIVEDDIKTSEELTNLIEKSFLEKGYAINVTSFYNAEDFLNNSNYKYDVIFMDIELPRMNGMDAIKLLREHNNDSLVVFVTNLANFAVNGYSVNAFDFIVKPLNQYEFKLKIDRIIKAINTNKDVTLIVNSSRNKYIINSKDLIFVEVDRHNIIYHTINEDIRVADSMKNVICQLNSTCFALCNQCYYVNLSYVKSIVDDYVIVRQYKLLISKPKRKDFIEELNKYLRNGCKNCL